MKPTDSKTKGKASDADILATAKERFEYSVERFAHNLAKMKEDVRFAAASPDDPWQWAKEDQTARKGRPMLTINKMPQHIRQVTNDIRQNRPSIRFRPADDKADPEVAQILMGLVRHIEANSDADVAYDTASEHVVTHGLGYFRVLTDYISDDSFDQDIFIGTVKDWTKCHDDPDAKDPAGADRKFFFFEETLKEDDFKKQYPDADPIDWTFAKDDGWFGGDKDVRIAEYFEVIEKDATLCLWANGSTSYKGDKMPDGLYMGEKPVKERKTTKCTVIWRKINGQQILEEREFPSKYIPVARVMGNVWEVDGKTYISGLVRNSKDSQRMVNVGSSAVVERVMQSPKAPWDGPVESFEGYEKIWQTANTANHSFLPWNHKDANGDPLPRPQRTQPTTVEAGLNQIVMMANDDIKAETGQYDASLGQKSNETSGRAIMARQREGDTATYHYIDNLGRGVRHLGRIILDMIPKVYDTQRVARIIGEDDDQSNAILSPDHPQALTEFKDEQGEIKRIFNPNVGTYDVYTTTGPSFTTRRMEAVEAMTQLMQASPGLWNVIGDLYVKSQDWPGAEDMAKRLKLTLSPAVQAEVNKDEGKGPQIPPEVQQTLQQTAQEMQAMQQVIGELKQENAGLKDEKAKIEVDAYSKVSARLKDLLPYMDPVAMELLARETIQQALQHPDPVPDGMPVIKPPMPPQMPPQMPQGAPQQQPAPAGFSLPQGA